MQVSTAKFAAEILTPDGIYLKFDDIGCFRDYLKEHTELAHAPQWVMDYSTGTTWISAGSAAYAIGAKEATPMGSAIVALPTRSEAEKHGARVVNYNEMMAGK